MKSNETKWNQVKSNGIKWNQMKPNETNWNGIKSIQTQWNDTKHTWTRAKPSETNWAPTPSPQSSYPTLVGLIGIYIYIYKLKRLPPLPPTSGTRGLDAWMLVFLLGWWQIWHEFESHFGGLWPFLVSAARSWCHLGSTEVARVPKWAIWHFCAGGSTDLRRFAGCWAQNLGSQWQPVASE